MPISFVTEGFFASYLEMEEKKYMNQYPGCELHPKRDQRQGIAPGGMYHFSLYKYLCTILNMLYGPTANGKNKLNAIEKFAECKGWAAPGQLRLWRTEKRFRQATVEGRKNYAGFYHWNLFHNSSPNLIQLWHFWDEALRYPNKLRHAILQAEEDCPGCQNKRPLADRNRIGYLLIETDVLIKAPPQRNTKLIMENLHEIGKILAEHVAELPGEEALQKEELMFAIRALAGLSQALVCQK